MGIRQGTAYLQLFAYGERAFCPDYLQARDTSALATLHGLHCHYAAKIEVKLVVKQFPYFLLRYLYCPAVEVVCLLVIIVKHLTENLLVGSVAVRAWDRDEVRLVDILPAVAVLFCHAATTLGESCIAYLIARDKNLTLCLPHGLTDTWQSLACYALLTLTMVVGADIEDGVVLTVVPPYQLVVFLHEREEAAARCLLIMAASHLCQEPGA